MNTKNNKFKFLSILVLSLVISTLLVQTVTATTFTGGRSSATFKAFYDQTVSNYGYTPHYDQARSNWNAVSSKVNITKQTTTNNYPDKYYVGNANNPPGKCLLGLQTRYKRNWLGNIVAADSSDKWLYSTVAIYHNSMTNCTSTNYSQKVSNATHEIGHSLALDHPQNTTSASVMHQGVQSIGPTTYDINDIISKWGN